MNVLNRIMNRALNVNGKVSLKTAQDQIFKLLKWRMGIYPPGHYYSPIPNKEDIPVKISIDYNSTIPGIDLNENYQIELLNKLKAFYSESIFPITKEETCRYYFDNDYFGYSDAIFLNALIREFKPNKIVEIGSGYSSAVMLETNENFFNGQIKLHFIEPFPEERLLLLIGKDENCTVIKEFVQNIDDSIWASLEENDILFIDSSHVSKFNSDVNYLFFHVLPRLKPGVIIHVHDIFFPFEYPVEWLKIGRFWNEAYLLRAFLQYNKEFEIILFSSLLENKHKSWFEKNMPLCLKTHKLIEINGNTTVIQTMGQSIYFRRSV